MVERPACPQADDQMQTARRLLREVGHAWRRNVQRIVLDVAGKFVYGILRLPLERKVPFVLAPPRFKANFIYMVRITDEKAFECMTATAGLSGVGVRMIAPIQVEIICTDEART